MSPCAPTIVLLTLDEMLEPFAEGLHRLFGTTALHDAGFRLWQMDASGNGQGSLAAIRDAAAYVLLRQAGSTTRRRTLTENAVLQHIGAAGRRQTLPVLEVVLQTQQGQAAPPPEPKLSQNPHFRRLTLPGHNRHLPVVIEALGVALANHTGPLPASDGSGQLTVAGVIFDDLDDAVDHPSWPELARVFGCVTDLADDPRFANGADATAVRWQQALALRNLTIGNRHGAIRHLNLLLALDDGHFVANFWLSRLLADSDSEAELEKSLAHARIANGHLDRGEPLLHSLLLTHQARANNRLGRHDAALAQARDACRLQVNEESLVTLVREVLAKLRRDGDIRLYHNEALVNEVVQAMQNLLATDPITYYRVMRQLEADHAGELLTQIAQRFTLALQKTALPVFRSEQEITLFTADCRSQPLLAPREAKPLPPWQQIDQCRDALANQLVLLQQCASQMEAEELELATLERQLREQQEWASALPSHIDSGHQQLQQALAGANRNRIAAALVVVASAVALGLGFAYLPSLRPLLGVLLAGAFLLAVGFVIAWRKHHDRARDQRTLLEDDVQLLECSLGEQAQPTTNARELVERLDFLASRLREENERLADAVDNRRKRLTTQAQQFAQLVDHYEEALQILGGRCQPPLIDEAAIHWQPRPLMHDSAPLPPTLRQRVRLASAGSGNGLARLSSDGWCRWAAYFGGCDDDERWQRLLSTQVSGQPLAPALEPSVENVVILHQDNSSPESIV